MGTTANKLSYLRQTKKQIIDKTNDIDGTITDQTTFRQASQKIVDVYNHYNNDTQTITPNSTTGKANYLKETKRLYKEGINLFVKKLPSEYQQVEYIESVGEQYIDTGINADYKLSFLAEFSFTDPEINQFIGAIRNDSGVYSRHHFAGDTTRNAYFYSNATSKQFQNSLDTDKHRYFIDMYNKNFKFDNDEEVNISYTNFNVNLNYWIFGRNSNQTNLIRYALIKLYTFKIYYENVLVRDFIPCYRKSDDEIGLYDLVNDVFYTNDGTGTFTKGKDIIVIDDEITDNTTFREYANKLEDIYTALPKVTENGTEVTLEGTKSGKMQIQPEGNLSQESLPDGYTALTYIESTGEQYIDTGVYGNLNTKIEIKASKTQITSSNVQLFGSINNDYSITVNIGAGNVTRFGNKQFTFRAYDYITADTLFIISTDKNNLKVNEQVAGTFNATEAFTTATTMFLLSANGATSKWDGKLYYCKIYDNDILVREFMPCKNSSNEVGLYDLVTKTFYGNQGTGTFIAGDETSFPNPDYPQDIKVVTGKNKVVVGGKNLFDKDNANTVFSYYNSNTDRIIVGGSSAYSIYLKIKPNKEYTISKEVGYTFRVATTATVPTSNVDVINTVANHTASSISIIANVNSNFLWINYYNENNGDTGGNLNMLKSIMVNEGDTALPYEPYIQPKDFDLDLTGKNLYYGTANSYSFTVPSKTWYFINGSSGAYGSNIGTKTLYKAKVKQGKTYTLRGIVTNVYMAQLVNSKEGIIRVSGVETFDSQMLANGVTFTANKDDDVILRLQILANSNVTVSEIQLEEASSATSYEPYYNYELAGIDEYKDLIFKNEPNNPNYNAELDVGAWYKLQNIDKYVCNNDLTSNGITAERVKLITPTLNVEENLGGDTFGNISLCNLLTTSTKNNTGLGGTTSISKIRINVSIDYATTYQEARELLSNLIIYFKNKVPKYIKITETTLINQLEELNRTIIPGGTIIVETESNEENAQLIVSTSALED